MTQRSKKHRAHTGRAYGGASIHAGPGVHEAALDFVKRNLPAGVRIADVGAGSGALSARLQDHGYRVTALDTDISEITAGIHAIEIDVTDLTNSVGKHTFDASLAIEVIEHVDSPTNLLRNMIQITRPGGLILISTPNVLHPYSRVKFLAKGTLWHFDPDSYWHTGHSNPLPLWVLRGHMETLGIEEIQHGYRGSFEMTGIRRPVVAILSAIARREKCSLRALDGCTTLFVLARTPPQRD